MLRLTLRTLLAYLDDTLEPAQAKDIGQKVAESEFAQETVERIKKVTRRRRLTVPPVEADDYSLDPNTIAEYLDNVLPAEQVTELEQAALDQDVRLAEVAACHQILTLVLGEPAKVPPTARRRMYRLVSGPAALRYRRPTAAAPPVAGVAVPGGRGRVPRATTTVRVGPRPAERALGVGLLLVIGLLVVAVWLAVPPTPPTPRQGYVAVAGQRVEPLPGMPRVPTVIPTQSHPRSPRSRWSRHFRPWSRTWGRCRVWSGEPAPGEIKAPDSERRVVADLRHANPTALVPQARNCGLGQSRSDRRPGLQHRYTARASGLPPGTVVGGWRPPPALGKRAGLARRSRFPNPASLCTSRARAPTRT